MPSRARIVVRKEANVFTPEFAGKIYLYLFKCFFAPLPPPPVTLLLRWASFDPCCLNGGWQRPELPYVVQRKQRNRPWAEYFIATLFPLCRKQMGWCYWMRGPSWSCLKIVQKVKMIGRIALETKKNNDKLKYWSFSDGVYLITFVRYDLQTV